jgi:dolichol-phosphate mannosyltransferase
MGEQRKIARPRIAIVTPVFNEVESLPTYRAAVDATLLRSDQAEFHILLVDDGSTDGSWAAIERLCAEDDRFSALRLSRNFGSHAALAAGLNRAEGDAVATLACDLQDPAEAVLAFVSKWREGADIVWGARRQRQDGAWRAWVSGLFAALIRRFAMPAGSQFTTGSFFLIDRRVCECYRQFSEHQRITFALVAWTGFEQARVEYDRRSRRAGRSSWTFTRMIRAMYDTFIGFSDLPIRLISWLGFGIWLVTVVAIIHLVTSYFTQDVLPGWTGLMVTTLLLFGLLFFALGLIGQYLHRIYRETTGRPVYFVAKEVGRFEAGRR